MVENTEAFDEKESSDTPVVSAVPVENDPKPDVLRSSSSGESSSDVSHSAHDKMVASGMTGAVLGFLLGGPILSALCGFGAAYVSQKDGAPGDAARAIGDIGISVKNKAAEVDKKHHIVERTSEAANGAWEGAKKYDQKYNVLEKSKRFTVDAWQSFVKFVRERRLLQRGVDGVGRGYEFVAGKVGSSGAGKN